MRALIISLVINICSMFLVICYAESQPEEKNFTMNIQGGSTVADYKLVSFPVKPIEDQDPWTNEAILIDDLGAYDPYQWRFFRWDPTLNGGLGDYKELNQREGEITWGSDQNIDYGRGYWIISVQEKTASVSGIADDSSKTILLERGWNQIGNPFYEMQSDLNVGPIGGPYVPLTDVDNDYTDQYVWEWVGGDYQIATGPLAAGKGYWIRNITEGLVELQFVPYQAATSEVKWISNDFSYLDPEQTEEPPSPPSAVGSSSSLSFSAGSGGGSEGGGCFIATAAYGDYNHPNVQFLRKFRDRYLLANSFGKTFVDIYYRYSPTLSRFVAKREPIKVLLRFNLMPIIGTSALVLKMNVYGFLIGVYLSLLGSWLFFRRRKGVLGRCNPKNVSKLKGGKRKA